MHPKRVEQRVAHSPLPRVENLVVSRKRERWCAGLLASRKLVDFVTKPTEADPETSVVRRKCGHASTEAQERETEFRERSTGEPEHFGVGGNEKGVGASGNRRHERQS